MIKMSKSKAQGRRWFCLHVGALVFGACSSEKIYLFHCLGDFYIAFKKLVHDCGPVKTLL